jgi:hypothetical protein
MKKTIIILLLMVMSFWFFAENPLFFPANRCLACHNKLSGQTGEDVSIGTQWRASMMANSARDPYWQGTVRREILQHPLAEKAIQNECSTCHMPMSRYIAKSKGELSSVFAFLPGLNSLGIVDQLAIDGVSCTICHQIQPDQLGKKESFTAGFVIDTAIPFGKRQIFGPHEVDAGRSTLMQSSSQFVPSQGNHLRTSEFCASCHTLITHTLDEKGQPMADFPEQVPYLEWQHSSFYQKVQCQDCHMPQVDHPIAISSVMGQDRPDFSRHVFRGGNFFMPRLLNLYRNQLGTDALAEELMAVSERTSRHLQQSSARLQVKNVSLKEGMFMAEVEIENLAGHKLPTAYPSRRVWLNVTVKDKSGTVLFESGALNADGSIQGNDNDRDGTLFEPHYSLIENSDQVQIYEAILADRNHCVTTFLLSAMQYAKDNRILPDGFDKHTAAGECAVHGRAQTDAQFQAGRHSTCYRVQLPKEIANGRIEVKLWYQPISYRWAHNLGADNVNSEGQRFLGYYQTAAKQSAIVLAHLELEW